LFDDPADADALQTKEIEVFSVFLYSDDHFELTKDVFFFSS